MKKFDYFHVSQVLSNIAVVLGIIFLAVQVREAGNASQLQTENDRAQGFNNLNITLATDPVLARIFVIGLNDPDRLTDVEAAQFSSYLRAIIDQHGQIYEQYRLGLIREDSWVYSARQAAQIYSTEGGKRFPETNDYQNSALMNAIRPYMGEELRSSFWLDRLPENF